MTALIAACAPWSRAIYFAIKRRSRQIRRLDLANMQQQDWDPAPVELASLERDTARAWRAAPAGR